jgi:hypothetical protein
MQSRCSFQIFHQRFGPFLPKGLRREDGFKKPLRAALASA